MYRIPNQDADTQHVFSMPDPQIESILVRDL